MFLFLFVPIICARQGKLTGKIIGISNKGQFISNGVLLVQGDSSEFISSFESAAYTPKQTPTPITFAPTPSASPTSNTDFFTSVGMLAFYIVFGVVLVLLVSLYIGFRYCKKSESDVFLSGANDQSLEDMNKPLTENPDLPDEGTVMI